MTCPLFMPADHARLEDLKGIRCDVEGADATFRRQWESRHRRVARAHGAFSCRFYSQEADYRARGLCPRLRFMADDGLVYELTFAREETNVILEWLESVQTMAHWMSPPVDMDGRWVEPWYRWTLAGTRERALTLAGLWEAKQASRGVAR